MFQNIYIFIFILNAYSRDWQEAIERNTVMSMTPSDGLLYIVIVFLHQNRPEAQFCQEQNQTRRAA